MSKQISEGSSGPLSGARRGRDGKVREDPRELRERRFEHQQIGEVMPPAQSHYSEMRYTCTPRSFLFSRPAAAWHDVFFRLTLVGRSSFRSTQQTAGLLRVAVLRYAFPSSKGTPARNIFTHKQVSQTSQTLAEHSSKLPSSDVVPQTSAQHYFHFSTVVPRFRKPSPGCS